MKEFGREGGAPFQELLQGQIVEPGELHPIGEDLEFAPTAWIQ